MLHSFTGGTSDGSNPTASLVSDASGALYGTTPLGGAYGKGTVFKLVAPTTTGGTWSETVLLSFTGGKDGSFPDAGLLSDASGALYGTTPLGGLDGAGTVFNLTPPAVAGGLWTESMLHTISEARAMGQSRSPVSSSMHRERSTGRPSMVAPEASAQCTS